MLHNIPDEMKSYDQWVVWRLEDHGGPKPTKVPYSPVTALPASVTNPAAWSDFATALTAINSGEVSGAGFVLTAEDPYGFIDLDNAWQKNEAGVYIHSDPQGVHGRQVKIFNAFDSYAERSPSGEGLHIIVKSPDLPTGRKRSSVELYTSKRYMTMTGDVFRDAPIREYGELTRILYDELGGPSQVYNVMGDIEQRQTDEEVFNQASNAQNGTKFSDLWAGNWETMYSSQSEADFALVDILAFYTQNRLQIERMFRASKLGERDKAKRADYVNYMVNKSFDRQLPPIDIEGIQLHMKEAIEAKSKASAGNGGGEGPPPPALSTAPIMAPGSTDTATANAPMPATNDTVNGDIPLPPGLVGDVARFIYEASPRPVMQISLAGALAFVSGLVGRAYNVSGTGLNNYFMLVAPTGTGKEAIQSGIMKLVHAVANGSEGAPAINDFIGPGEIRSDAALIKWFMKSKAFLSILGEIGLTISRMSHPNANPHDKAILKVWLDLYNKSGHGDVLNPMAYSDAAKNTEPVQAPSFTMIGESVPEKFYEALDETMVSSGLLPRFVIIEYDGVRAPFNEAASHVQPHENLVRSIKALVAHVNHVNKATGGVVNVPYTKEARELLTRFDKYADSQINSASAETTRHLWNRAHLKALKLAAVVAVGIYPTSPVIDLPCAQWAVDLVSRDIRNLLQRFERGEVGGLGGHNDAKQYADICKFLSRVVRMSPAEAERKYQIPANLFNAAIFPVGAIHKGCRALASFRNAKMNPTSTINAMVKLMCETGDLQEMPKSQLAAFNTTQRAVMITNPKIIE